MRRSASIPEDDSGSYLASVSDLMSALMFVFILTLVVFALTFQIETQRMTNSESARKQLLIDIKDALLKLGETRVEVDAEQGVVRFGAAILFASSKADVTDDGKQAIQRLSEVLADVLPCYSLGRPAQCRDRGMNGMVDAVFVEGHTDKNPFAQPGREYDDNWDLSSARARKVFDEMKLSNGRLVGFQNENGELLFSVSGYAESRPVSAVADEPNRRIDLRFVMVPPKEARNLPAQQTLEGMKVQ